MTRRYRVLVGGEWIGDDRKGIEVINPYDGSLVGTVPESTGEDLDRAVISARKGYEIVSSMPAHRRSEILAGTAELLLRDRDEIAAIIAREAGKSWKYAASEVERGAETFSFAALYIPAT